MTRIGILFPGQGAQHAGMGRALWERFRSVREIFDCASDVLARDLRALCFEGTDDALRSTDVAQPALYVVGYAGWLAWREVHADRTEVVVGAGHSLGEYTVLAAAGAFSFADGLRLVAERGRLMQQAGDRMPGMMVAVLGLAVSQVVEICAEAGRRLGPNEVVAVANDNAPGQVVISGTNEAVELASALAWDRGARRVVPLATSGAFHSPLMHPASAELTRAIEQTSFGRAAFPIVANSTAKAIQEPAEIRQELAAQLCAPVRWVESVARIGEYRVDQLVELGPGRVLAGLVKRIDPRIAVLSIGDGEQLAAVGWS